MRSARIPSLKGSKHLLLVPVLLLGIIPFFLHVHNGAGEMSGTDSQAEETITKDVPHYKPWFTPLWVPPGSEMESLLFSLQSGLGGLALGYILGRMHRQDKQKHEKEDSDP